MVIYNVSVKNRIAELVSQTEDTVAGNKGDEVRFTFDEEWGNIEEKTAIFVWNGQYHPVSFSGVSCKVPPIFESKNFRLGVTAGESLEDDKYLSSTSIVIPCKLSIRDYATNPRLEAEQYYASKAQKYSIDAKKSADKSEKSANESKEALYEAENAADSAKTSLQKAKDYSEISKLYSEKAMNSGARAFYTDTFDDLFSFLKTGSPKLKRISDNVVVEYSPKDLDTGDTIYIKELNVPDFWWVKTDTMDGAFEYNGEILAYPLVERYTLYQRMEEIDKAIYNKNEQFTDNDVAINTNGENLQPDYSWYQENDGSAEHPYRIGTPAQLLALSNLSNGIYDPFLIGESTASIKRFGDCYFVQTANIDMGGTRFMPISFGKRESYDSPTEKDNYDNLFYDGDGHYIANFVQSGYRVGGIFGNVGGGGYIKNLTLKSANITANADAGGIAGVIMAGMDIINCHIEDTCTITSRCILDGKAMEGTAGGIAGFFTASEDPTKLSKIEYCTNDATIISAARAGGLIGSARDGAISQFAYCVNRGPITVNSTLRTAIGGIVGFVSRGGVVLPSELIFSHCYNTGMLYADTTNQYLFMGGIAGDVRGDAVSNLTLEYCYDFSNRSYHTGSGEAYNYALVGIYDDAQMNKKFYFCHADNDIHGAYESFYSELGHYMNKSNVTVESSSVLEHGDPNWPFVDFYRNITCQLQPIESYILDTLEDIGNLVIRCNDLEKEIELQRSFTKLLSKSIGASTFMIDGRSWVFVDGMTWDDFVGSEYNVDGLFDRSDYGHPLYNITLNPNLPSHREIVDTLLSDMIIDGKTYEWV